MSLDSGDHTDLGTLVGYALQPTQRPGRSAEYRRLLGRYRGERDFRAATDAVLHGLGASVLSDGEFGLVLGISPESPFAFRLSDLPGTGTREGKVLSGLVLLGLAAYAYPRPDELDDDRVRRVHDVTFEEWLRGVCESLRERSAAGEEIPEEGLDESWRVYAAMPSAMVGERGAGSGRLSRGCTLYWVRSVLGWLAEQGMARHEGPDSTDAGGWVLTERFRIQVRELAAESAYRLLAAIGRRRAEGSS